MVSRVQLTLCDQNFAALASGRDPLRLKFAEICNTEKFDLQTDKSIKNLRATRSQIKLHLQRRFGQVVGEKIINMLIALNPTCPDQIEVGVYIDLV